MSLGQCSYYVVFIANRIVCFSIFLSLCLLFPFSIIIFFFLSAVLSFSVSLSALCSYVFFFSAVSISFSLFPSGNLSLSFPICLHLPLLSDSQSICIFIPIFFFTSVKEYPFFVSLILSVLPISLTPSVFLSSVSLSVHHAVMSRFYQYLNTLCTVYTALLIIVLVIPLPFNFLICK